RLTLMCISPFGSVRDLGGRARRLSREAARAAPSCRGPRPVGWAVSRTAAARGAARRRRGSLEAGPYSGESPRGACSGGGGRGGGGEGGGERDRREDEDPRRGGEAREVRRMLGERALDRLLDEQEAEGGRCEACTDGRRGRPPRPEPGEQRLPAAGERGAAR